jgi:hypothetical protein
MPIDLKQSAVLNEILDDDDDGEYSLHEEHSEDDD